MNESRQNRSIETEYEGRIFGRILAMVSILCSIIYFTLYFSPLSPIFVLVGLGFGFAAVVLSVVQVRKKLPAKMPLIFGVLGLFMNLLGMTYGIYRHLKG